MLNRHFSWSNRLVSPFFGGTFRAFSKANFAAVWPCQNLHPRALMRRRRRRFWGGWISIGKNGGFRQPSMAILSNKIQFVFLDDLNIAMDFDGCLMDVQ